MTAHVLSLLERELALELFHCGAFKNKTRSAEGLGYTLKLHEKHPEAPLSPFYMNLPGLTSGVSYLYSSSMSCPESCSPCMLT